MDSKVDQTQSSPTESLNQREVYRLFRRSTHTPSNLSAQMKFNSTCFSYQCRVWNQVCATEIHMDISQRNFRSTFPPEKKEQPPKSMLACTDTMFGSNSNENSEHQAFKAACQEKFFTPVAPKLCFAWLHVTLVVPKGRTETELLEGLTEIAETW